MHSEEEVVARIEVALRVHFIKADGSRKPHIFKSEVLVGLLQGTTPTDFGKEIIPAAIHEHRVFSFVHDV